MVYISDMSIHYAELIYIQTDSMTDTFSFTVNTFSVISFSLSCATFLAARITYASFCATDDRYVAIVNLLDHWDAFFKTVSEAERVAFEQAQPGELARLLKNMGESVI